MEERRSDSIMKDFEVKPIIKNETRSWLLNTHYAKRLPMIDYSFGLFHNKILVGVMTLGRMTNPQEHERWKPYEFNELNRLVVKENLPKNSLSFFVSQCLKQLRKRLLERWNTLGLPYPKGKNERYEIQERKDYQRSLF